MTDAKDMWIAIKSRFGGNDESKKMQKYILKQQFEGFTVSNSDGIHKEDYERSPKVKTQSARDSSSRYSGNLSYENEVFQSVFRCNASDYENPPLHKRDIIMNSDGFKSDQEGIYNAKNSTTKWSLLKKEQNNARLLLKATDKRKDNYEEVIAPMARHLKHKELFSICLPIWVYSISNGCEEMPFSMARFDEELQELGMHTFIHFLVKNGYDEVTIDKTHFLKKDKPRYHFSQEFYVDDIIFDYKKVLVVMISGFDENRFQMSSMGELTSFLAYKSMIGSVDVSGLLLDLTLFYRLSIFYGFKSRRKTSHLTENPQQEVSNFLAKDSYMAIAKKQTNVATSTPKAEYVSAIKASCCGASS
ncbi:hypothetical protein Tco_0065178 [Tanacetum coccineum]